MMRKRVSSRRELPVGQHSQSKVRKVVRKARNIRDRADIWGNEVVLYLSRPSLKLPFHLLRQLYPTSAN
jgi:hypothetical protein